VDIEIRCEDAERLDPAQDGVNWWSFVNMVMNLRVPLKGGLFD
jgi:hypothetical protein